MREASIQKKTTCVAAVLLALLLSLWACPVFADTAKAPEPGKGSQPARLLLTDDHSYPPFAFRDGDGQARGITIDLWRLWSERTGVALDITLRDWDDALTAVQEGNADAVGGLFRTPERQPIFDFVPLGIDITTSIYFHERIHGISNLTDLAGFEVGVVRGDSAEELIRRGFPRIRIRAYASAEELVTVARKGDIRVFVMDTPTARFYLSRFDAGEQFREVKRPVAKNRFYAGVKKGNEPLLRLVEEGFSRISQAEREAVIDTWTGLSLTPEIPWRLLGSVIAGGLAVLLGVLLWTVQLRRRVARAARQLQESNLAVEKSERNYSEIFNTTNELIFIHDAETGKILDVNRAVLEAYGFRREEMIGKGIDIVSSGVGLFTGEEALRRVQLAFTGESTRFEWQTKRKDGSTFWAEVSLHGSRMGGENRVLAVVRDISERKRAEVEQTRLTDILENTSDLVSTSTPDAAVTYLNPAGRRMIGWKEDEDISLLRISDLHPRWALFIIETEALPTAAKEGVWRGQTALLHRDGRELPVSQVVLSHRATDGSIDYFSTVMRDMSAEKQAETALRESEQTLRDMIELAVDGILTGDSEGTINGVNSSILKILGMDAADVIGKHVRELFPPQELEQKPLRFDLLAEGQTVASERQILRPDGTRIYVEMHSKRMPDGSYHSFVRDVTQRKLAEQELSESRRMLRDVIDTIPVRVFWKDFDGKYLGCNNLFAQDAGRPDPESLVGDDDFSMGWAEQAELYRADDREVIEQNKAKLHYEEPQTTPDGRRIWLRTSKVPLRDEEGKVYGILGAYEDITERKLAEEALRRSETCLASIITASNSGAWEYDKNTGEIWCSPEYFTMLGYPSSDNFLTDGRLDIQSTWVDLLHPDDRKTATGRFTDYLESGSLGMYENHFRLRHRDGTWVWIWARGKTLRNADDTPTSRTLGTHIDITERKQAEEALRESERRFRKTINANPMGMFFYELEDGDRLVFRGANESADRILGVSCRQFIGKTIEEAFPPLAQTEVPERYRKAAAHDIPWWTEQVTYEHGDIVGAYEVHAFQIEPRRMAVMFTDITERIRAREEQERLEAQLRHQQKLESIGTLAGGVAHEINNPIGVIINYAQLISDTTPKNSPIQEDLQMIQEEGHRIARIVKNLLAFSRQEKESHSPARLEDVINTTLSLVQKILAKSDIEIKLDIPGNFPKVKCRSQQVMQVLMNLITNARDALETHYPTAHPRKCIHISLSAFEMGGRNWQRIQVQDFGPGIPEAIRDKVFDPFFTTKPREQGTGLGLSVSHGIVKEHHGSLWFETHEGEGTCFFLDLPVDNGWSLD